MISLKVPRNSKNVEAAKELLERLIILDEMERRNMRLKPRQVESWLGCKPDEAWDRFQALTAEIEIIRDGKVISPGVQIQ
ncbi:MAG TPA: hypothetical protein PKD49_02870 [Hyphomicrobium sp.]|nr:hypothetical protein [Hyphomicrobium sp.]